MAERLYGYGISPGGVNYTARIYDTDFVGTSIGFETARGGIEITWSADKPDDRHAPIKGSSCKVTMLLPVDDVDLNSFVDDVRTSKEGRFWMEVVSGGGATVRWRGILVADISNERDEAAYYTVTMTAVCGLGLLKKTPYYNSGALYFNSSTLVSHLTRALGKLAHMAMWAAGDDFLETSVDWWAETMSTGGANDALFLAQVDHAAFYDYHTTGSTDKDVLSCYDVISHIVRSFGAHIKMYDGKFIVEQIDYRSNSTYEYRRYKKDGTFLSNSGYSGVNTINQTDTGAKLSYVEYDYLPQLSKTSVTYQANLRRNFWGNIIPTQGNVFNFNQAIDSNSGATTFKINGLFRVTIKNNSYSGSLTDSIFAEMKLYLKIGSNYLKRSVTYSGFSVIPGTASWTGTPGDSADFVSGGTSSVPAVGSSVTLFIPVQSFITPPLPADGDTNTFQCGFGQLMKQGNVGVDESQFTINWSADSFFLELYDGGTPDVLEDNVLYETENPDDGTEKWEADIRLGGGSTNYQGRLRSAANYAYQEWAQGVVTPYAPLGALLSEVAMNGQLRPIKRLNGQIYGQGISPWKLIRTSEPLDWFPMQLTWSPTEDMLSGSWFEMDYGTAGVPSTPVLVKVLTGGTKLPQMPGATIPVTTGNNNQGFATNSPGVVLAPISFNNISAAITAGATITSIGLTDAATGTEFISGDSVTLCHPITGQYQTFEVATAPVFGATSLSVVSEVADFSAPVGSFLVVKQKAFAFSLPKAVQGQILRYNAGSGKWEAYSGTVDGRVLTWDTTNGWQEEALPGGTGTVTSVALTVPSILSVAGSPITTAGTLAVTLATQAANLIFAGPSSGGAATPTFRALALADFAANLLTFAKIQQIVTASILGRVTGATGDIEVLTSTQATTLINVFTSALKGLVPASGGGTTNFMRADGTWAAPVGTGVTQSGTLVNNRITISAGSNQVKDFAAFTVDGTNNRMTITGTVAGTGANNAFLNLNSGAITGATEFFRASGNINGNLIGTLINANNTSSANTLLQIVTGGTSAGDPIVQFIVTGGAGTVAVGLDNSDGDKFKITPNSSTPGGTANSGLIITQAATPLVGINKDVPIHALDVEGRVKSSTGFVGKFAQWLAGNIAFGAGAGTGPTLNSISGTDNALYLSFTTGTLPTGGAVILTATYPNTWPATSFVSFSADGTNNSATDITKFRTGGRTAAKFDFVANGTLTASTNYQFCFSIFGS